MSVKSIGDRELEWFECGPDLLAAWTSSDVKPLCVWPGCNWTAGVIVRTTGQEWRGLAFCARHLGRAIASEES